MIWQPLPCYAVLSPPVLMYVFLMPSTWLVNHWLQQSIPVRCDSGSSHGTHVYVYACIPNSPSSLIRLLSIVHPWFFNSLAPIIIIDPIWHYRTWSTDVDINNMLWHSTEVISLEMPEIFTNKDLWCILSSLLTHWGRVKHTCIGKLTSIGSDNDLSPGRHQAIIWTNAGILLIWPYLCENVIEIHTVSMKKMHLKMSSAKWWPFCLSLYVLMCPSMDLVVQIRPWCAQNVFKKYEYVFCIWYHSSTHKRFSCWDLFLTKMRTIFCSQYHGRWWLDRCKEPGHQQQCYWPIYPRMFKPRYQKG